jgi:hypothetical protein
VLSVNNLWTVNIWMYCPFISILESKTLIITCNNGKIKTHNLISTHFFVNSTHNMTINSHYPHPIHRRLSRSSIMPRLFGIVIFTGYQQTLKKKKSSRLLDSMYSLLKSNCAFIQMRQQNKNWWSSTDTYMMWIYPVRENIICIWDANESLRRGLFHLFLRLIFWQTPTCSLNFTVLTADKFELTLKHSLW